MPTSLRCVTCASDVPAGARWLCPACGSLLEAVVDLGGAAAVGREGFLARPDRSIWRWREFFPIEPGTAPVSLGEGSTPLRASPRLRTALDLPRLLVKYDGVLPTGSLKDRSNSLALTHARERGARVVAVASTGNAAASVAAYAAAAGLPAVVLVPEATAPGKVAQALACGARVLPVRGTYDETAALFAEAVEAFGWHPCLSTNPYRNEGKKSYGYELWEALGEEVPYCTIHPTAGGTAAAATFKGYGELRALGWVPTVPRIVCVQPEACAPLVRAFTEELPRVEPVEAGKTLAESIWVGRPSPMATRALGAVRASGGTAVAVNDAAIERAQVLLAEAAGLYAEPAAAASVAAAAVLRAAGWLPREALTVCIVTGHGLKQPSPIPPRLPPPVPARLAALERVLAVRGRELP